MLWTWSVDHMNETERLLVSTHTKPLPPCSTAERGKCHILTFIRCLRFFFFGVHTLLTELPFVSDSHPNKLQVNLRLNCCIDWANKPYICMFWQNPIGNEQEYLTWLGMLIWWVKNSVLENNMRKYLYKTI